MIRNELFPGRFYDAAFIEEYGSLEALRSSRYASAFSLILVEVEPSGEGETRSEESRLEYCRGLVSLTLESLRTCDVAGMTADGRIAAILPETGYFGSLGAVRKLCESFKSLAAGPDEPGFTALVSQATCPRDGRGFDEVMAAASRRITEKRESVWTRGRFEKKLFWEIVAEVSGSSLSDRRCAYFEAGADRPLPEFFIDRINEMIANELTRSPSSRGVLYHSTRRITPSLPFLKGLAAAPVAARVFVVAGPGGPAERIENATPILLDDARIGETMFTLYLGEETGYALICTEAWGGTYSCFHTSDEYLVEGLITKFQSEYSLQEQLA